MPQLQQMDKVVETVCRNLHNHGTRVRVGRYSWDNSSLLKHLCSDLLTEYGEPYIDDEYGFAVDKEKLLEDFIAEFQVLSAIQRNEIPATSAEWQQADSPTVRKMWYRMNERTATTVAA